MAPMSRVRREALGRALQELCTDLHYDEVCVHLLSKDILTQSDDQVIRSKVTTVDKASELVAILRTKGDSAFDALVEAVQENQDFLAKSLKKHEENVRNNVPPAEGGAEEDVEGIPWEQIANPDDMVTDKDLNQIATGLGHNWKEVGMCLGLKKNQIDACEADNPHTQHDKAFGMLNKWKKKAKKDGTRGAIVTALAKVPVDPDAYEFLLVAQH